MSRDPFGPWTRRRRVKWLVLTFLTCCLFAPRFIQGLQPPPFMLIDFYNEWASAKNLFSDLPIYAPVKTTVQRYLGLQSVPGTNDWDVSVHPPTSVLLAVPLQWLDYPTAFIVWNLLSVAALIASIWIVIRHLEIRFSIWCLLPLISLLLVCEPFYQQMRQGQLNLVLLVLIVGVWAADRSQRPYLAGTLLSTAAAIKLFPGFLVFYFILQRKWKTVAAVVVSFSAITALTAVILGVETYRTYITQIMPIATAWKTAWNNASLTGFWHKLFHPGVRISSLTPLVASPTLALTGTVLSCGLVVACLARTLWRAKTQRQRDHAFGLTITAMLLVSPVTWEHYFLLLLLPLMLVWSDLPKTRFLTGSRVLVNVALALPIIIMCNILIPGGFASGRATVLHTLTLLSFQCYALCGLYCLALYAAHGKTRVEDMDGESQQLDRSDALTAHHHPKLDCVPVDANST